MDYFRSSAYIRRVCLGAWEMGGGRGSWSNATNQWTQNQNSKAISGYNPEKVSRNLLDKWEDGAVVLFRVHKQKEREREGARERERVGSLASGINKQHVFPKCGWNRPSPLGFQDECFHWVLWDCHHQTASDYRCFQQSISPSGTGKKQFVKM